MSTPTVAICIPTYNQAGFLPLAVRSAQAQTAVEVEVWISNDASTDHTVGVMADLKHEFPSLKCFTQKTNLGMSGNPDWLLRQPKTDWLVKLDSDDLLAPYYCSKLIGLLQCHPQAGYAHAAVREIDDMGGMRRVRRLARPTGFVSAEDNLRQSILGYKVAANIILFRRAALESVDFWCKGFAFADDWDLSVRLADAGWGNVHCAEVLASYRVWNDAGGYRQGRKISELVGTRRVFEESLGPAFARRGWSAHSLAKARCRYAKLQVRSLNVVPKNNAEYREIVSQLKLLGDSPGLRLRLLVVRVGLGRLLDVCAWVYLWARDWAKRMLTSRPVKATPT